MGLENAIQEKHLTEAFQVQGDLYQSDGLVKTSHESKMSDDDQVNLHSMNAEGRSFDPQLVRLAFDDFDTVFIVKSASVFN